VAKHYRGLSLRLELERFNAQTLRANYAVDSGEAAAWSDAWQSPWPDAPDRPADDRPGRL